MKFDVNDLLSIDEYKKYLVGIGRISIIKLEKLLLNNNEENKIQFFYGFLPIAFNNAIAIYDRFSEFIDGYYSPMDFVQEANCVLLEFLYGNYQEYNFRTIQLFMYSYYRQLLRRIVNVFTIKKPFCLLEEYSKLQKDVDDLSEKFNGTKLELYVMLSSQLNTSLDHLENLDMLFSKVLPLNGGVINSIKDDNLFSDEVINKIYYEELREAILNLSLGELDRLVLMKRFGFSEDPTDNSKAMTLQEISDETGYSREGIRLIQNKVLERVKNLNIVRNNGN